MCFGIYSWQPLNLPRVEKQENIVTLAISSLGATHFRKHKQLPTYPMFCLCLLNGDNDSCEEIICQ